MSISEILLKKKTKEIIYYMNVVVIFEDRGDATSAQVLLTHFCVGMPASDICHSRLVFWQWLVFLQSLVEFIAFIIMTA